MGNQAVFGLLILLGAHPMETTGDPSSFLWDGMTIPSGTSRTLGPGPGRIGKCEGLFAAKGGAPLVSVEKSKATTSSSPKLRHPASSICFLAGRVEA